ncbi:hypothetical protein BaRGS_00006223 [Batillaria attramentaria]|uniref:Uncharacterized protein n=1 Tax=Batillaria attramentaria TaxID=370345 RepID=A0ABD0LTY2_9CAEN
MAYYTFFERTRERDFCAYFCRCRVNGIFVLKDEGCWFRRTQDYLCELETTAVDTGNTARPDSQELGIVIAIPKLWMFSSTVSYTECPAGHVTHDFLACDVQSACWSPGDLLTSCLVLLFQCTNGFERVHYTFVCDYRPDCSDASDEKFCVFPPCRITEFSCGNQQCLPHEQLCDGVEQCANGADEKVCLNSEFLSVTDIMPPASIDFVNGKLSVTPLDVSRISSLELNVHLVHMFPNLETLNMSGSDVDRVLYTTTPVEGVVPSDRTCSIKRNGDMTLFSGEHYKRVVVLPCKYRLAEFKCHGFQVKVIPGSRMEADTGCFTPDTVYVRVDHIADKKHWRGRTSNRLVVKQNTEGSVWRTQGGDLPRIKHEYDEKRKAAVVSKVNKFEVVFRNLDDNGDDAGVEVTCFSDDNFENTEYPKSLCDVLGCKTTSFRKILSYDILNQNILQSRWCDDLAATFQECEQSDQVGAVQTCNGLAERSNVAMCLAAEDRAIADNYVDCVNYVCSKDASACTRLKDDVTKNGCPAQTAELFPFIKDCFAGK